MVLVISITKTTWTQPDIPVATLCLPSVNVLQTLETGYFQSQFDETIKFYYIVPSKSINYNKTKD